MNDLIFYVCGFLTAALYAVVLERIGKHRYEPDYTVVTVIIGVGFTGLWVAARLLFAPLPDKSPEELIWWSWWLWVFMFASTGSAITVWQLWQIRNAFAAVGTI